MKFFTEEKYQNGTSHSEYEKYCRSIWHKLGNEIKCINTGMLPEDMLEGLADIDLHDSKIIGFNKTSSFLEIELNTDNHGELRKVWLKYLCPNIVELPSCNVLGDNSEHRDSDFMCHEIYKLSDEQFMHLILLASNEELVLEFHESSVKFEDVA